MIDLNVFTDEDGNYGNPVGIVVDVDCKIDKDERQKITYKSGLSEVIFINSFKEKNISIYSPLREIPFAGHAIIGAVYFLNEEFNTSIAEIVTIEGRVGVWKEREQIWIRGKLENAPPWKLELLESVGELEKLNAAQMLNLAHTLVWTWIDKDKGIIRARTFANDWGIPEDEANGSGSMMLAAKLDRSLTVYHGKGSVIHARPSKPGFAEVGGLVKIVKE